MANTDASSSKPVAIITGGASGIGLSVVEHLVDDGWRVAIFDLNQEAGHILTERLGSDTIFVKVDVSDYEQQASAYAKTWDKWRRLDFVFANAGVADHSNLSAPAQPRADGLPPRPDTTVIDVCLLGVIYSAQLALHFFRQNTSKGGKFVSTSSMAGIYPSKPMPLYTAAKHGVIGLTRSMAMGLSELNEPITFNCICPGLLDTGLTQPLMPFAPKEYITPHSTIVRAVESFLEDDSKCGLAAECSGTNIYYRTQQDWADAAAEWVMTVRWEDLLTRGDAPW